MQINHLKETALANKKKTRQFWFHGDFNIKSKYTFGPSKCWIFIVIIVVTIQGKHVTLKTCDAHRKHIMPCIYMYSNYSIQNLVEKHTTVNKIMCAFLKARSKQTSKIRATVQHTQKSQVDWCDL